MRKFFIFSFLFFILFVILVSGSTLAKAEEVGEVEEERDGLLFEENFTSWDNIDRDNTDALVDLRKGEVRLPEVSGNQSFDVTDGAIIVMNGNVIELHTRGEDGHFSKHTQYTDEQALALAFTDNGYSHYILREEDEGKSVGVTKMEFGAGSFIKNPVIGLSGFRSATTLSASREHFMIGELYDISTFVEGESFLGFSGSMETEHYITQVAYGPYQEIIISMANEVHVFRISDVGYVESPYERLTGPSYVEMNELDWRSGLQGNDIYFELEPHGLNININHGGVVATKLYGGSLFVRDSHSITEYVFDGNRFLKATQITGLSEMKKKHLTPREYLSLEIELPEPLERFGIVAEMETPETTTIEFEISPDGITFIPADEDNRVILDEPTEIIYIKAILDYNEPEFSHVTPILKNLKIYDATLSIEKFEVTRIVRDPGGNPELPTEEPVRLWGGYNFDMRVTTFGGVKVVVHFSNGEMVEVIEEEEGVFIGTHHFPPDEEEETINATIEAQDEKGNVVFEDYLDHFIIVDNIMNNYRVYHTR